MSNSNDIISILDAINEINLKPKKKITKNISPQKIIPKLNQDLIVPPDVDRIISEAEDFKKLTISPAKSILVEKKNFPSKDTIILTDEMLDASKDEDKKIVELNNKIRVLKQTEVELRLQIKNFKKNKSALLKENLDNVEFQAPETSTKNIRETLFAIYKQVEKQKQLFLDLKNYSNNIERDSIVYRENYERLIIENNELKRKLEIAREQIVNHETNKSDLLSAMDQLNEIISKSNIVGKISHQKLSSLKPNLKKEDKSESFD